MNRISLGLMVTWVDEDFKSSIGGAGLYAGGRSGDCG